MSVEPDQYRYTSSRSEMLSFIPTGINRLLDVGCATGAFAETVRAAQPALEVWGIEADPVAIRLARPRMSSLVVGHFPDVSKDLPVGYFDCIVFNDVLEHMVEPALALAAAVELLAPGGCIVASIPNVRHVTVLAQLIGRGEFRYTDWGIMDRTHLRFFTRRSILRMFAEGGWEVEKIQGINWTPWARFSTPAQLRLCKIVRGRLDEFYDQQYAVVARRMT